MISSLIFCFIVGAVLAAEEDFRSAYIKTREDKRLLGYVVKKIDSTDEISCSKACLRHSWCTSSNFKESSGNCELNKHEFSTADDDTKLTDNPGTTFSMFLKGCLMAGCLNGGSCFFDEGKDTSACSCSPQWRGEKCEIDINECETGKHHCDSHAFCNSTKGSYNCTCKPGYFGNGFNCTEFMNSSILNSSDYYFRHLGNFLENAVGDNSHWLLCWRATLHGWDVSQFHSRCDGKYHTVTIIRKGKFIFGGYTDIPWESSGGYSATSEAFIFSLNNNEGLAPFVSKVKKEYSGKAIYRWSYYGPRFGRDVIIRNNADSNDKSVASLGYRYSAPPAVQGRYTVLAGIEYFSPNEVEVFYLDTSR
ncbi:unnamed protein product [Porites lobata]|uniref:Uncharacterized protein n=1 Tax=Porites lobata TaxID=104759 RepID=A0ABN8Q2C8_9CNID|nr:unnamed protein product [Porites lobata]